MKPRGRGAAFHRGRGEGSPAQAESWVPRLAASLVMASVSMNLCVCVCVCVCVCEAAYGKWGAV